MLPIYHIQFYLLIMRVFIIINYIHIRKQITYIACLLQCQIFHNRMSVIKKLILNSSYITFKTVDKVGLHKVI